MIYVVNDSTNPFFNHAVEEYIMKEFSQEAFILWRNRQAILIGRNQNTLTEINEDYVREAGIDVVRRLSGGGTVFNDLGNINFTLITHKEEGGGSLGEGFEKFARPVIGALHSLGVPAKFTGRNDITIEEKKFSGNAQYHHKNKVLHHGTILYEGNLERLAQALRSKLVKFQDKSVKSVASRVTNVKNYMEQDMDVVEFRDYLKEYIKEYYRITEEYHLQPEDLAAIEKIQKERFESWEWNYGRTPAYSFSNAARFPAGTLEVALEVQEGKIRNLRIYGDYFGEAPVEELLVHLEGKPFQREHLQDVLETLDLQKYIKGLSGEELLSVLTDINLVK